MKKFIVLMLFISSFTYTIDFEVGKEFINNGILTIKDSSDTKVDIKDTNGFYLEVYQGDINISGVPFIAGVGLRLNNYQVSDTDKAIGTVATLYGIARYEADLSILKPYVQLRFGYPYFGQSDYVNEYNNPLSLYNNDMVGEYYMSAGIGTTVSILDISLNYEYNTYKLKSNHFEELKASSANVSLNFGLKF